MKDKPKQYGRKIKEGATKKTASGTTNTPEYDVRSLWS